MEWKDIALEYQKEVQELWADIEDAYVEFSKGVPKSFSKGLHLLEKSLDSSRENVRILRYIEPCDNKVYESKLIEKKKPQKSEKRDEEKDKNSFKWLRGYQQK